MGYLRTIRDRPCASTQAKSMCYPCPGMNFHLGEPRPRELPVFGEGWGGVLAFFEQSTPKGPTRPHFRSATPPEVGEGF